MKNRQYLKIFISTNNEHFTCYGTSYKPALFNKIATYDVFQIIMEN
jgi:hypothetical protein